MGGVPGNEFWKARSKHGRPKLGGDPRRLWDSCCEYFQWCVDNPLLEQKVLGTPSGPQKTNLEKCRAFTIRGLCLFLDIHESTWYYWAKSDDYCDICEKAEQVIREQKFTAAAADLLNPALIARDLGLVDKKEVTNTVRGELKMVTSDMTPQQAAEVWLEVLRSEDVPVQETLPDLTSNKRDNLDDV